MKYIISLFLVFNVSAAPIRLFHEEGREWASIIKQTLVKEYQIPSELIEITKIDSCRELREQGRLDLCLKNNGDLIVVSVDRQFVLESLRIFRAPQEQP